MSLRKQLYGLFHAGDYWGHKIHKNFTNDLGMELTIGDSALYTKIEDGQVAGVSCSYVKKPVNAGSKAFKKLTKQTLQRFESKPGIQEAFDFYGTQTSTFDSGVFTVKQNYFI